MVIDGAHLEEEKQSWKIGEGKDPGGAFEFCALWSRPLLWQECGNKAA